MVAGFSGSSAPPVHAGIAVCYTTLRIFAMRALSTLTAVIGLGAAATAFGSTAHANDWSIGIGIGLPGVVVVAPPPVYLSPPPRYYESPYPPQYYAPGYYRPPLIGYYRYPDYDRHRHRHHHEHDDDEDDED
jgi:hypothetical protein